MSDTLTSHWTEHYQAQFVPQDESAWMQKLRKQAWEIYLDMPEPPPPQRSLRKVPELDRSQLQPSTELKQSLNQSLNSRSESWGQHAGRYLESSGQAQIQELQSELKDQGVIFCALSDALKQHEDLVQKHFGQIYPAISGKDVALNMAYWRGGYFLYVPRNVQIDLPLYALASVQGNGEACFMRSLVVLEANAQATLIHDTSSETSAQSSLVSEVLELIVADNARLNLMNLQQWGQQTHSLCHAQSSLQRDARLTLLNIGTGSKFAYTHSAATLEAAGAETKLLGLFAGQDEQHFRQNSLQSHLAPHTVSDLKYHTVLRDKSYSFYNGMIFVDGKGQQTESNQVSKGLLLSDDARADAIPNLEILADDVQSGHGAAIGSIDKEQLFYLKSRGFDHDTAESMLVEGFMESVLLEFPVPELHDAIAQHLSMQLLTQSEEAGEDEA